MTNTTLDQNDESRPQADRRDINARRRHADSRSVCIELCRSVLRIAIVTNEQRDEKPRLKTKTLRWRHDAPDLCCEEGRAELSAALRELVSKERLAGCRALIAINSTLCVNRASSGASAKVEQEIDAFEERSQFYLALGAGDKITAAARKQTDARHLQALVTVANEETLRMIVEAAESAGLNVAVVESSLLSLCRLQGVLDMGDEAVVLAQLDDDRYEVGVCRHGQLLLEYRPAGDAKPESLDEVIDDHRERMQRYCRRQYGIGDMTLGRLFLVGDEESTELVGKSTSSGEPYNVLPMTVAPDYWEIEEESPTGEMAASLGLALRDVLADIGASPNLMDKILAEARTPLRPFLMRASLPLVATLLIAVGLGIYNFEQRMELDVIRNEYNLLQPQATRSQQLSLQLHQYEMRVSHLRDLAERAPNTQVAPIVDHIGQCLPSDVWLKRVTLDGNESASISGASYSESGVYEFVRHLDGAPWFGDVALRGTDLDQTAQGPATGFDLALKLAPTTETAEENTNE